MQHPGSGLAERRPCRDSRAVGIAGLGEVGPVRPQHVRHRFILRRRRRAVVFLELPEHAQVVGLLEVEWVLVARGARRPDGDSAILPGASPQSPTSAASSGTDGARACSMMSIPMHVTYQYSLSTQMDTAWLTRLRQGRHSRGAARSGSGSPPGSKPVRPGPHRQPAGRIHRHGSPDGRRRASDEAGQCHADGRSASSCLNHPSSRFQLAKGVAGPETDPRGPRRRAAPSPQRPEADRRHRTTACRVLPDPKVSERPARIGVPGIAGTPRRIPLASDRKQSRRSCPHAER